MSLSNDATTAGTALRIGKFRQLEFKAHNSSSTAGNGTGSSENGNKIPESTASNVATMAIILSVVIVVLMTIMILYICSLHHQKHDGLNKQDLNSNSGAGLEMNPPVDVEAPRLSDSSKQSGSSAAMTSLQKPERAQQVAMDDPTSPEMSEPPASDVFAAEVFVRDPALSGSAIELLLRHDPDLSRMSADTKEVLALNVRAVHELRMMDKARLRELGLKIGDRNCVLTWKKRLAAEKIRNAARLIGLRGASQRLSQHKLAYSSSTALASPGLDMVNPGCVTVQHNERNLEDWRIGVSSEIETLFSSEPGLVDLQDSGKQKLGNHVNTVADLAALDAVKLRSLGLSIGDRNRLQQWQLLVNQEGEPSHDTTPRHHSAATAWSDSSRTADQHPARCSQLMDDAQSGEVGETEVDLLVRSDPILIRMRDEAKETLTSHVSTTTELIELDRPALRALNLSIGDRNCVLAWIRASSTA